MKKPHNFLTRPMLGVSLLVLLMGMLVSPAAIAQKADQLYKNFEDTYTGLPRNCFDGEPERYIDALKYLFAYSEVAADYLALPQHQDWKEEVDRMLEDLQGIAANMDVCLGLENGASGTCSDPDGCIFPDEKLQADLPSEPPFSSIDTAQGDWVWIPQQNENTCSTVCATADAEAVTIGAREACASHVANELDNPFLHLGVLRPGVTQCMIPGAENRAAEAQSTFSCLCALKRIFPPLFGRFKDMRQPVAGSNTAQLTDNLVPRLVSPVPRLVSPQQGAEMNNRCVEQGRDSREWTFDWSDVPNAQSYRLKVTTKEGRIGIEEDIVGRSTYTFKSTAHILDNNRMGWSWRVRAQVAGRWGEWSNEQSFNVKRVGRRCR